MSCYKASHHHVVTQYLFQAAMLPDSYSAGDSSNGHGVAAPAALQVQTCAAIGRSTMMPSCTLCATGIAEPSTIEQASHVRRTMPDSPPSPNSHDQLPCSL
jgi:hypothetical protein